MSIPNILLAFAEGGAATVNLSASGALLSTFTNPPAYAMHLSQSVLLNGVPSAIATGLSF